MTDLTIRGNRHERRKATRLARKVQNGTSQRNITAAYNTWKRSGDARADSITFREFSVQRPDQNADYVPARWSAWAQRRNDQQQTIDIADVDDSEVLVPGPDNERPEPLDAAFPETVSQSETALDVLVQAAAEDAGGIGFIPDETFASLAADIAVADGILTEEQVAPVKKTRKPRAKKTDEAAV